MIKINLLPPHILEGRKVKLVAIAMGVLVLLVAVAMSAWVWFAPAPISLTSQVAKAKEELANLQVEAKKVTDMEAETASIGGRYSQRQLWVDFVAQADAVPARWVTWFDRIRRWVPAEVALDSLPLPNGNVLTLSGHTSDYRAANRWWHSMLRCDMLDLTGDVSQTVRVNPSMPGGAAGGDNPRMAYPVTLTVTLNGNYLQHMTSAPAVPNGMGAGTSGGYGARGGGGGGGGGGRMGMGGGMGGGMGMGRR